MTGKWVVRIHMQRGIFYTMKRLGPALQAATVLVAMTGEKNIWLYM